jgi:hypothetical protein
MSIEGKKKAGVKLLGTITAECEAFKPQWFLHGALFYSQQMNRLQAFRATPADRFNDDGTLKPEDMTGKVVTAAGGGNPEGLRVMLNDVLKDGWEW